MHLEYFIFENEVLAEPKTFSERCFTFFGFCKCIWYALNALGKQTYFSVSQKFWFCACFNFLENIASQHSSRFFFWLFYIYSYCKLLKFLYALHFCKMCLFWFWNFCIYTLNRSKYFVSFAQLKQLIKQKIFNKKSFKI